MSDDIFVRSGTGYGGGGMTPIVEVTVNGRVLLMTPADARKVGLDLIGAAHSAVADTALRAIAREHGLDGDGLVVDLREKTDEALP